MQQPHLTPKQAGFTLLELVVVMAIIGILAAIGISSFATTQVKARDARRKGDLSSLTKALEAYNTDHGSYPLSSAGEIVCNADTSATCAWGSEFVDEKGTVYMAQLPEDPKAFEYQYVAESTGSWFAVLARLENEQDQSWPDASGQRGVYTLAPDLTATSCGGSGCGFVVTAPGATPAFVVVQDESTAKDTGGGAVDVESV